jgi:dihydrofolate reductase
MATTLDGVVAGENDEMDLFDFKEEGSWTDLADLKRQRGGDIILYGGPTAAAAVIDAGLVDEFHLNVHPLIAGRGKKLFANVAERRRLRHRDTTTFSPGLVALKYERA